MKTAAEALKRAMPRLTASENPIPAVNVQDWATFFRFDLKGDLVTRKQLDAMIVAAATFVRGVRGGNMPCWLSLLGKSGAGKTYLAKGIWGWYSRSSHFHANMDDKEIIYPGSWCFWPILAQDLLNNTGYGELQDLTREKLIVIDEIGADRDPSGHVRDCLSRLLSARVGKWTIITSNKSLGEIQRDIDTRISSRMVRDGSLVVDVDITDYALRK